VLRPGLRQPERSLRTRAFKRWARAAVLVDGIAIVIALASLALVRLAEVGPAYAAVPLGALLGGVLPLQLAVVSVLRASRS
jgi:hypothetical protein